MFNRIGLKDLGFFGFPFTWSNHQSGNDLIEERLDRGVANSHWTTLFPNASVRHLNHLGSDHSSILLKTEIPTQDGYKPFKFFGLYQEEQKCRDIIKSSWEARIQGSHAFVLVNRLVVVKREVSLWNRTDFGNIKNNISSLNKKIDLILSNTNVRLDNPELVETKLEIQKLHDYEKELWKIKGRENTISLGDKNTHFFHQNVVIRQRRNKILGLYDSTNTWIEGRNKITSFLNNHFESLLTTSAPIINYC